jgi:hypothetical protein
MTVVLAPANVYTVFTGGVDRSGRQRRHETRKAISMAAA